jgi:hypothetical protein
MKIDAYANLNDRCVSVKSREPDNYGRVVAHRPKIHIADAEFVVWPSGRQRARERGVKNVHAFVRGKWDESEKVVCGDPVAYDPFEYDHFVHAESERPVESAERCAVTMNKVYANGLSYLAETETIK